MRKSSALMLGGGIFVAIAGFVARAWWEPEPPFRGLEKLHGFERSGVEDYVEMNPPMRRPLTFETVLGRLMKPFEQRDPAMFGVTAVNHTDGSEAFYLFYPDDRQDVHLEILPDGSWVEVDVSGKTPIIGNFFQTE